MLFAVERLSERSEDWPTNNSPLDIEMNNRAAGLPGAGKWTVLFSEVCRLAGAEKLLPREPLACMNGIHLRTL